MALADYGASRSLSRGGLQARYYANPDWKGGPILAAVEPRPSTSLLRRRLPELPRPYSAEWDGGLWVDRAETRSFSLITGGQAWLDLDGRRVLQATATGGLRVYGPALPLEAGWHRLRLRYAPLGLGLSDDGRLDLTWQEGDGRPRPLPRYALSPVANAPQGPSGRWAGWLTVTARPLWVAGLVLLSSALLFRVAVRLAVAKGRSVEAGERALLFSASLLLTSAVLLFSGSPDLLWSELDLDKGRLLVALALYALLPWLLLRTLPAARHAGWRTLLLGGLSLLVSLGMGEVVLRVWSPDDALPRFRWIASTRYHHINPPRLRMFAGRVGNEPVIVETNEDGLRSPHSRQAFRGYGVRILVLGDSFAFGPGVRGEGAFPARLEQVLRERLGRQDIAVLNAGVIGYSPLLEKRQFADLVEHYRPTLVLLLLDATDIGDDDIYARLARPGKGGPTFEAQGDTRLAYRGALYERLRPLLGWLKEALAYPWVLAGDALELSREAGRGGFNYYVLPIEVDGQPDNRFFIYRHPLDKTRPFFESTLGHVREIAALARTAGSGFALLVSPRYHHWSDREAPDNWERTIYGTDEPYEYEYFRFFDESRPRVDFPIHDLLPAFRATDEFPLVFPNDPHWNEKGHAFVASTVSDTLLGQGLLRP